MGFALLLQMIMEGQERVAELGHGVSTDRFREVLLHAAQMFEAREHPFSTLRREHDAFGAAVACVGNTREDAGLLEVVNELPHGLFADADALRQGGLTGSLEINVGKKSHVRRPRPEAGG